MPRTTGATCTETTERTRPSLPCNVTQFAYRRPSSTSRPGGLPRQLEIRNRPWSIAVYRSARQATGVAAVNRLVMSR